MAGSSFSKIAIDFGIDVLGPVVHLCTCKSTYNSVSISLFLRKPHFWLL